MTGPSQAAGSATPGRLGAGFLHVADERHQGHGAAAAANSAQS